MKGEKIAWPFVLEYKRFCDFVKILATWPRNTKDTFNISPPTSSASMFSNRLAGVDNKLNLEFALALVLLFEKFKVAVMILFLTKLKLLIFYSLFTYLHIGSTCCPSFFSRPKWTYRLRMYSVDGRTSYLSTGWMAAYFAIISCLEFQSFAGWLMSPLWPILDICNLSLWHCVTFLNFFNI